MRGGMGAAGAPRQPWKAAPPPEDEPDLAGRAAGARKKGAWVRAWLMLDAAGQAEVLETGKHSIMRRAGLPARDLRILDPLLSYPSTVLGRERAIVVNLEHIKAVITANEVLLLNYRDPSVDNFVGELRRRLVHRHHRLHGGSDDQKEDEAGENSDWADVYDLEEPRSRTSSPRHSSGNVNYSGGLHGNLETDDKGRGALKSNPVNSDVPRFLPFEFVALEACLDAACSCLENEATTLEKEAHPALDKLTSKISTLNLERVRQIKSRLVAITGRVQKVRDELEHLLDDDDDMAEMYLTDKLMQQYLSNGSFSHSINEQNDDLDVERLTAETSMEENDTRDNIKDDFQSTDYNHDRLLSGPNLVIGDSHRTHTSSTRSGSKHLDVEELEMLLEAYFVQIDSTLNKMSTVRGICICGDAGITTSSRDRTIRLWSPDPEKKHKYLLSKTLVGHSSFVGPLAWISPCDRFPEGRLVSGGMDAMVLMWDLRKGEVVETMKGHQLQVTSLAVDDTGDIISSSIDCTIRRWRNGHAVEYWEAHKLPVQVVIKLSSGEFITGSSDSTLKLWKGRTCLHTFVGHTDTVRCLAVMPAYGILSASHDCSIRLWALTGQVLMEMIGHTSLVYCVDSHPSGLVASGSEDRFLKIWRGGICVQSIEHPGCVWDARFLENGDIVTACSDGIVRIWTSHKDRFAEPLVLEAYEFEISQYKISRKKIGGLKLEELPGLETLKVPGTTDGQTKIIREGDNGVAYSWNSREQKWDKIGEVVDGPGDGGNNQVLDGSQYDYVFDVDIGDGEPIRKLPYNRRDNPYTTADKWLLKENLPLSYREQVVEFILQNSGQRDFSLDTSFRDPYTGSSAYMPGGASLSSGGGASLSSGSVSKPAFKHIPKKGMLLFESAPFDGILKKISEFNSELLMNVEHKSLSLTELELSRLAAIVKILRDTSHYHCSIFANVDIILLTKILQTWPVSMMFPVIDILRMVILHPDGASLLLKQIEDGNDVLMETFKKATMAPAQAPNLLTITRAIVNLFKQSCFSQWLKSHCSEIMDALANCRSSFNKNVHLSFSTLVMNYAVLLIEMKDLEGQSQVLSAVLEIAEDGNQDVDSRFRALVALGSLMLDGLVKTIAIDFDAQNIAKEAKASMEAKIAEVGADIENIIKAT